MRTFFSSLFCGGLAVLAIPFLVSRKARGSRFALASPLGAAAVCVLPWFLPAAWGEWRSPMPLRYPEKFAVALVLRARRRRPGSRRTRSGAGTRLPRWRLPVAVALAARRRGGVPCARAPSGQRRRRRFACRRVFAGDAGRQIA